VHTHTLYCSNRRWVELDRIRVRTYTRLLNNLNDDNSGANSRDSVIVFLGKTTHTHIQILYQRKNGKTLLLLLQAIFKNTNNR